MKMIKTKNKFFSLVLLVVIIIILALYFNNSNKKENDYIIGTITYFDDFSIEITTPNNEEYILITKNLKNNLSEDISVGDTITAYYSGEIMESYPMQIIIDSIELH